MFAAGVVLVVCLLWLAHDRSFFWKDDYQISVLPVFADVARSWSHGEWPLLSPSSWVCGNLAGEFQYGTFSVFVNALVVVIWKFPLSFAAQAAALSIAHLLVLTIGSYLLARDRYLSGPLSTMVAWIAALNGWIICWGATDWFGALGAFAWLPWAWWGCARALDPERGRWRFLYPAPFVYLVVTGGFPYTVVMLALLAAWLAVKSLGQTRRLGSVGPLVVGGLLGLGLSAPAWLALLAAVPGSVREAQDASQHWQWLVPLASLPGFILPNWTVPWADFSTRYVPRMAIDLAGGLAAPAILLAALATQARSLVRRIGWELALLLLVLLLSMLPTINMFRWSFRWLPLLHLLLALCAAEAWPLLDQAASMRTRGKQWLFAPGFWALGLCVAAGVSMIVLQTMSGPRGVTLLIIIVAISWMLTDALRWRAIRLWMPAAVTLVTLGGLYFFLPRTGGVPRFNFTEKLRTPAPLDPTRLYLSFYPAPEYAYREEAHARPVGQVTRPGSTPMWTGLRFINGYSPIRAAGVASAFATTIHGDVDPGMAEYLAGWRAGAGGELAALGVDGIIVARELSIVPKPDSEWFLVYSDAEGSVYHRRTKLPRVSSLSRKNDRPNEQFAIAQVSRVNDSRNRVAAEVAVPNGGAPALIAFSRPYFTGYRADLNGRALAVQSYEGLMPVVEVPAGGRGKLTLTYRPWWLVTGGAAAVICLAVILTTGLMAWRKPG